MWSKERRAPGRTLGWVGQGDRIPDNVVYRKRWTVQRFSTAKKMKGKKSIPDIISLILLVTACRAVVIYNSRTIREKMA